MVKAESRKKVSALKIEQPGLLNKHMHFILPQIMDSSWKGYMLHLKVLKPITGAVNMVPLLRGPHRPNTHTSRGHDSSTKPGPATAYGLKIHSSTILI